MFPAISYNRQLAQIRDADIINKNALVHSASECLQRQQALEQPKVGTSIDSTLNSTNGGALQVTAPLTLLELEQGCASRSANTLSDVYSVSGLSEPARVASGSLLRACA